MREDPRSFADISDHAQALVAELQVAQGTGYIRGPAPEHDNPGHPKLPTFPNRGTSHGSGNLASHVTEGHNHTVVQVLCHHVRFLEFEVERLAAQVSEMAERLAAQPRERGNDDR